MKTAFTFFKIVILAVFTFFSTQVLATSSSYSTQSNDTDTTKSSSVTSTQNGYSTQNKQVKVSDETITTNVKQKFSSDNSISNSGVTVNSKNGVVHLAGLVDTDSEASALVQHASSIEGVKDVDATELKVKESKEPFKDTVITAKVKGAFIREKLFGEQEVPVFTITVETTDGIVVLTGKADTQAQAKTAVKLAKQVHDVRQVKSKITW